ncbi:MAG: alpha/beta fold hydrolase [Chloroflexota bacterium]|nr:alpha/beta fold hydrolase [Chloroflexota bacterium]
MSQQPRDDHRAPAPDADIPDETHLQGDEAYEDAAGYEAFEYDQAEGDEGYEDEAPPPALPPLVSLPSWRYGPDAWRWVRRADRRYVDRILRLRSGTALPASLKARFGALGLPPEAVESTLREVRSVADWPHAWIRTAQRYLGDFRRQSSASDEPAAAQARYSAALCYHIAQIFVENDARTVRLCRAATASLFAQAQPHIAPSLRRLELPWRAGALPAYLALPEAAQQGHRPTALVTLLNGVSTAKEETIAWAAPFLAVNLAVLAIDSPGTGEATKLGPYDADHDDIADGVLEYAANEPLLDPRKVALLGISLGGAQAIRCVAYDRRLLAAVTVTAPYQPTLWLHRASPLLLGQLAYLTGDPQTASAELATGFDLTDTVDDVRCPVFVFGGARDVIVPPTESQRLAAAFGELATLSWYPGGGHCLYEYLPAWTTEAATWLGAVAEARGEGEGWSTRVDAAAAGAFARERLEDFFQPLPGAEAPQVQESGEYEEDPEALFAPEELDAPPERPSRPARDNRRG